MTLRLGVDVGGTHTDAVVVDQDQVVAVCKSLTTSDIAAGISTAIDQVLSESGIAAGKLHAVMLGTTQFTNAVVERRELKETAAIRLGLPATASVPPLYDWPDDLHRALGNHTFLVHGGHHYDGTVLSPVAETEIAEVAAALRERELTAAAITSVFAPVNDASERHFAAGLRRQIPDLDITLSCELGRVGLLERENATLLNSSLKHFARHVVGAFESALIDLNIAAPFFLSQNDGTLMAASAAMDYPVLTFSSGPTNSMRGASFLCGTGNAVVVDVGGTTADIGMLIDGFPRESSVAVDIGGVPTNFRMPDVLALGLGGGTRVDGDAIGPESVGHDLVTRARVFGGDVLTATDVAVAAGRVAIGDPAKVADLDADYVRAIGERFSQMVADGIDRIKTAAMPVPVIAVGGGHFLVPDSLPGVSEVIRPKHAAVANAIGAALAKVSGEAEVIYSRSETSREAALARVEAKARSRAIEAGALADTLVVVDIEEVAMAYLAEGAGRIRLRVVGDLDLDVRS